MKPSTFRRIFQFALITSICLSNAYAQENQPSLKLRPLLQMALEMGGEPVATVDFTNGNSQNVNAGQGVSLGVGGELSFLPNKQLGLRFPGCFSPLV